MKTLVISVLFSCISIYLLISIGKNSVRADVTPRYEANCGDLFVGRVVLDSFQPRDGAWAAYNNKGQEIILPRAHCVLTRQ
jgi:hypothetical protein